MDKNTIEWHNPYDVRCEPSSFAFSMPHVHYHFEGAVVGTKDLEIRCVDCDTMKEYVDGEWVCVNRECKSHGK